jgi:4-amino-4-deoxy-L-arabinose transferase-like glycosyltransferase
LWLALILVLAVYLPTAGGYAIIDADDADYANMAWNMISRWDFITPYVNDARNSTSRRCGLMIAASYGLLGKTEYAARLPPLFL